jgi:predicted transcriptional regulator of viral defense system
MAKILNWITVRKELKKKRLSIFTPDDLVRIFEVTPVAARFFVFRGTRRGVLTRLKKAQKGSLYCLADETPDQYTIANRLYEPSYVSFDTALSFHNIIPETVYAVTSATPKATRAFKVDGSQFVYHRVKKTAYTGYRPVEYMHRTVLMATPEKAVADYLYFVALKQRGLHYDRWNLTGVRKSRLLESIRLFDQDSMFGLLERIYAQS